MLPHRMTPPATSTDPTGSGSGGPDPTIVRALVAACQDFGADALEGLALFEAAIVASDLRADLEETDDRLGVLGQNPMWGPAAARRDPYTAATVFLRQARRARTGSGSPRLAAHLATVVQGGPGPWHHAGAHRQAKRLFALVATDRSVDAGGGARATLRPEA